MFAGHGKYTFTTQRNFVTDFTQVSTIYGNFERIYAHLTWICAVFKQSLASSRHILTSLSSSQWLKRRLLNFLADFTQVSTVFYFFSTILRNF